MTPPPMFAVPTPAAVGVFEKVTVRLMTSDPNVIFSR